MADKLVMAFFQFVCLKINIGYNFSNMQLAINPPLNYLQLIVSPRRFSRR